MQVSMAARVQMSEKIAVKKLPSASVSLLGSGVMQWSKDKQIDVLQGTRCQLVALQMSHYRITAYAVQKP